MRPDTLVKFDEIFTISAKKRMSTAELKNSLRHLLDVYAERELEATGVVESAIAQIQELNQEKFDRHLV